jgi:thymidylate kinase
MVSADGVKPCFMNYMDLPPRAAVQRRHGKSMADRVVKGSRSIPEWVKKKWDFIVDLVWIKC